MIGYCITNLKDLYCWRINITLSFYIFFIVEGWNIAIFNLKKIFTRIGSHIKRILYVYQHILFIIFSLFIQIKPFIKFSLHFICIFRQGNFKETSFLTCILSIFHKFFISVFCSFLFCKAFDKNRERKAANFSLLFELFYFFLL